MCGKCAAGRGGLIGLRFRRLSDEEEVSALDCAARKWH